jgi:hypothetical protein
MASNPSPEYLRGNANTYIAYLRGRIEGLMLQSDRVPELLEAIRDYFAAVDDERKCHEQ